MSNLAVTLRAQGDLERARKLQEQVLDACTRIFGGEDPDTLISMNNLAGTLYTQGNLEGARKLQKLVLNALTRLCPRCRFCPNSRAVAHKSRDEAGSRGMNWDGGLGRTKPDDPGRSATFRCHLVHKPKSLSNSVRDKSLFF
jgi:hypothetical protein